MRNYTGLLIISGLVWALSSCGGDQPATESGSDSTDGTPETSGMSLSEAAPGATVFIISPVNGATVSSPVEVKFGITGMAVAPAGEMQENSGHHHLLVDMGLGDLTQPIPTDEHHLHFGKGQTETSIELAPGQHTLQLVLGDGVHVPHDPPVMSDLVVITVE
jgi:hypothetical protein